MSEETRSATGGDGALCVRERQRIHAAFREIVLAHDPDEAAEALVKAALDLSGASRGDLYYWDCAARQLWAPGGGGELDSSEESLCALAIASRAALVVACGAEHPTFRQAVDDPGRVGGPLLIVPIVEGHEGQEGHEGREPHAVIALAAAPADELRPQAREAVGELARAVVPALDHLESTFAVEATLDGARGTLFADEAVRARAERGIEGDVIRVTPPWLGAAYVGLIAVFALTILFIVTVDVPTSVEGPAVIRLEGRRTISAPVSAALRSFAVVPGQRVRVGQLLAQLDDSAAKIALREARERHADALRDLLRDPGSPDLERLVASRAIDVEERRRTLDRLRVLASHDGIVGAVHRKPGDAVAVGDALLTLAEEDGEVSVIALLPGQVSGSIAAHRTLRLRFASHPEEFFAAEVDALAEELVGPAAARRYLGSAQADSVELGGSIAIVRARMEPATDRRGARVSLHEGMLGTAVATTRSEPLVFLLFPALRGLMAKVS